MQIGSLMAGMVGMFLMVGYLCAFLFVLFCLHRITQSLGEISRSLYRPRQEATLYGIANALNSIQSSLGGIQKALDRLPTPMEVHLSELDKRREAARDEPPQDR